MPHANWERPLRGDRASVGAAEGSHEGYPYNLKVGSRLDTLTFFRNRLIHILPVLFGIVLLVFLMVRLIPGDPARIILGVMTIALFDRDAFTWSVELTIISAAAVAVYLVVALIVRRWTPSRAN